MSFGGVEEVVVFVDCFGNLRVLVVSRQKLDESVDPLARIFSQQNLHELGQLEQKEKEKYMH